LSLWGKGRAVKVDSALEITIFLAVWISSTYILIMSVINNEKEAIQRMHVKLYPNYRPQEEGTYIARTSNETSLTIEQICTAIKNRGCFEGNYGDLIENVRQFFDEMAYQLCDGYVVNTGYFSIHPNIGGTFDSEKEAYDHKKHPISFCLRTRAAMRRLVKHIAVEVDGLADSTGWIDEFTDFNLDSVNGIFLEDNIFKISGHKIKIAGDDPACGVYIVPVNAPAKAAKVTRIAENTTSTIIGRAVSTRQKYNKIEIRTQFSGSDTSLLKTPRTITSHFLIEEARG